MKEIQEKFDVVIVGAGAAGLLCAYYAGLRGKSVLLLERSNKAGKKILMSGGGKCNFTNLGVQAQHFLCPNPHFVKSALAQYTAWDFLALVQAHQIAYYEKTQGQLFCRDSSKPILSMLLSNCESVGVDLRLNCEVEILDASSPFTVMANGVRVCSDSLVVATGGKSIPSLGGSDFAYRFAESIGLTVNPCVAGLVPVTLTGKWKRIAQALTGVSCLAQVKTAGAVFTDSLLFTHRGLSGPVILQISNYWQLGQSIRINLMPEIDLQAEIIQAKKEGVIRLGTFLSRYLSKSIVRVFLENLWDTPADIHLQDMSKLKLAELIEIFQSCEIIPSGTQGYRTAEVTLGGVDVNQLSSKSMEVKTHKNLYIIGEALDVTGQLGGYNFQWAWSSAYAAAQRL